ncbi:antigen-presenting glycoprotein CD1d1-like isoform 1-T1 [Discoglossus pictus]
MSVYLFLCMLSGLAAVTENMKMTILQSSEFSNDMMTMSVWASGMLRDIETHHIYNDTRMIVFKQSWSRGNISTLSWGIYNMFFVSYFRYFKKHTTHIMSGVGQKSPFIVQCQMGCTTDPEDKRSMYYKVALNGQEVVYLDVAHGIWIPSQHPNSSYIQEMMTEDKGSTRDIRNFLQTTCVLFANDLSVSGKEALEKKIQPQVFISSRLVGPEMEVICTVTKFYPEAINVTLWKDMDHRMDDTFSTVTLPNEDNTFQIQTLVIIAQGEEQTLYCRVEHSSLKEPIMVHWDNRHSPVAWTIGVILGISLFILGIMWLIMRQRGRRMYGAIIGTNVDNSPI